MEPIRYGNVRLTAAHLILDILHLGCRTYFDDVSKIDGIIFNVIAMLIGIAQISNEPITTTQLADLLDEKPRTVRTWVAKLVARGFVKRERQHLYLNVAMISDATAIEIRRLVLAAADKIR